MDHSFSCDFQRKTEVYVYSYEGQVTISILLHCVSQRKILEAAFPVVSVDYRSSILLYLLEGKQSKRIQKQRHLNKIGNSGV